MMTIRHTFFCDEAGNSGSNFLDEKQPFYVTGGWLIPNKLKKDESFINRIKQLLNTNEELHTNKIVKNPQGRSKLKKIIESLLDFHLIPFLSVTEKNFAVAAKVIETLLDPAYNDSVSVNITNDSLEKGKKYYAEKIYNLEKSSLEKFANAYRYGNIDLMKNSILLMSKQLNDNKEHKLSQKIKKSLKYLEENLTLEYEVTNNSQNKVLASLNLPMFVMITNMLEIYGYQCKYKIDIIHDDIHEFKDGYIKYFELMNNSKQSSSYIQVRNEIMPTGFSYIKSLKFDESKDNIFIQCADVLVSSVNRCMCEFIKESGMDESTTKLWETVLPMLFSWNDPKLTHLMVSENLTIKILKSMSNKIK